MAVQNSAAVALPSSESSLLQPGTQTPLNVEALTTIWETVLQRSPLGLDDNFFDAGGTPALAHKLVAQIARSFARDLPALAICHAPTVRLMAAMLQRPTLEFSPLVLLKPGKEKTPVFIAHGLDGSVMRFARLSRHISSDRPIYGVQARGLDGLQAPFDRIEAMAAYYVDAIRQLQPEGPYSLIGYSLGGLPMLEAARILSENGRQIAMLVLLDSYPHLRYLSCSKRMGVRAQRLRHHALEMKRRSALDALSYLVRHVRNRFSSSQDSSGEQKPRQAGQFYPRAADQVRKHTLAALRNYRPRFYNGKITFVKTEGDYYFPSDPAAVWSGLASEIEVQKVPGDHLGMINERFEHLGPVLSRYL